MGGGVKVLQYHAFSSPISLFSPKGMIDIQLADFIGKNETISAFTKRCTMCDFNKSMLDFVFKKKSDYFILDILDARLKLMKQNEHIFTKNIFMQLDDFPHHLGLNKYEELNPFTDISEEQWEDSIDKLTEHIQRHYSPAQIIIPLHYGVKEYIKDSVLKKFVLWRKDYTNAFNPLVKKLFKRIINNLDGCHVIEFPDNVVADADHKWGLSPLHYNKIYYEYAAEAVKVILRSLSDHEEKGELEKLKSVCSERFEMLHTKEELNALKRKLTSCNSALEFAKAHAFDCYESKILEKWLILNKGKRIAVLKCQDVAGQILLKGLKKYGFNIIFSTSNSNFEKLTVEEMRLCKEADIVVSADIHSNILPEHDSVKVIRINELLENANQ